MQVHGGRADIHGRHRASRRGRPGDAGAQAGGAGGSDRITLRIDGSREVAAALAVHRDYVMEETLATGWDKADWSPAYSVEHTLGAERWTIGLARVAGG